MFYETIVFLLKPVFWPYLAFPKVIHRENLELIKEGPAIICCNHKCNYDPVLLGMISKRPINFMAKKQLFYKKFPNWFLRNMKAFPVDRDTNDLKSVKHSLKLLKDGELLGIFPEGQRNKEASVLPFKEGIALIAHRAKVPVLPIGIKGNYGIFKRPTVEIGTPIDFSDAYGQKASTELFMQMTQVMHDRVEELALS